MHTQQAVVATAGGGVIAEITVTALTHEHVIAALDLMHKLVEVTAPGAVVGLGPRRTLVSAQETAALGGVHS